MAYSDTKIHQIELLLTLDYLLNHTDEEHPATQIDICKHARKFGLTYNGGKAGDDVKRQRIGECLKFLREITDKFTDDVPFVLETTDSGKYYVEQKHGLNGTQIAKVLAAIKNDKYTKDDDVDFLIERVLCALSTSEENKIFIHNEYKQLLRGVKKLDKETLRKIRLIDKAYKENRLIKIKYAIIDTNSKTRVNYYFWYRVYLIKEFHNKLHAFLLPAHTGNIQFFNNYIFEPIEKINVCDGPDKEVLNYDEDEHSDFSDFEELFKRSNPELARKYGSLDKMIEQMIIPHGGKSCIVSYYFPLEVKDIIARSFKDYFNEEFRYQETNMIRGIEKEVADIADQMENWTIVTEEPTNSPPTHGLVNISVDNNSFKSWLLSDPHEDGQVCIADLITIIKPKSILEELAEYHYRHLLKNITYLNERAKDNLFNALINTTDFDKMN